MKSHIKEINDLDIQKVRLNFCSHYANNVKDRTEVLKEALISIK